MNAATQELKMEKQSGTSPPLITPLLVLISAPSGGGKTTLCKALLAASPQMNPRRDLHHGARRARASRTAWIITFWTRHHSSSAWQAGNFLEHATVYGNSYGTLKSEVLGKLRQGKDVSAQRGRAGRRDNPRKGQRGPGIESRVIFRVF